MTKVNTFVLTRETNQKDGYGVDVDMNVNDEVDVDMIGGDTHVSLLKVSSEAKFLAKQKFPLALENIGEFGWQT